MKHIGRSKVSEYRKACACVAFFALGAREARVAFFTLGANAACVTFRAFDIHGGGIIQAAIIGP